MKRRRDDIDASSSQDKPPLGSPPNEPPGLAEAWSYLKEIEETFHDQKQKYLEFLEMMNDFEAKRIARDAVIERAEELFKGHNNLILGFNKFLPKRLDIKLDGPKKMVKLDGEEAAPPKKMVKLEDVISFLDKMKRFQHDRNVIESFSHIIDMYDKKNKNITEVYNEISTLFEGHSDLIEDFTRIVQDAQVPHTAELLLRSQAADDRGSGN